MYVSVKPVLTAVQLVPLFVERKTPPTKVPAKRFEPETARAKTPVLVRPVLTAVQLVPLLVDRKTPPPYVPAKRFEPETAKHGIRPAYGPPVWFHWACNGFMAVNRQNT